MKTSKFNVEDYLQDKWIKEEYDKLVKEENEICNIFFKLNNLTVDSFLRQYQIFKIIKDEKINNELDYERSLVMDRKLRVLCKKNHEFKPVRKKLRDLIEQYEEENWSTDSKISDKKILLSDVAELIVEKERLQLDIEKINNRAKSVIKNDVRGQVEKHESLFGIDSKNYNLIQKFKKWVFVKFFKKRILEIHSKAFNDGVKVGYKLK